MTKILFVCHGNICRSTMAQFVFLHLARQEGREEDFYVDSAGVSAEELGNVNKVPKITFSSGFEGVGTISVSSLIATLQLGEANAANR